MSRWLKLVKLVTALFVRDFDRYGDDKLVNAVLERRSKDIFDIARIVGTHWEGALDGQHEQDDHVRLRGVYPPPRVGKGSSVE